MGPVIFPEILLLIRYSTFQISVRISDFSFHRLMNVFWFCQVVFFSNAYSIRNRRRFTGGGDMGDICPPRREKNEEKLGKKEKRRDQRKRTENF